jgi:hypothetical protein
MKWGKILMMWQPLTGFLAETRGPFLASAVLGALLGSLFGGVASAWAAYAFARRMFRDQVLDHARREIKGPLGAYVEWLTTVSGEFALWKADLLSSYLPDSGQDQFELNRMRKLFVDQRNVLWIDRLEEYEAILPAFAPAVTALWVRQTEIAQAFDTVFRNLEADPPLAAEAGNRIEALAFEQSRLVSDLLHQLQYECLRAVAKRKPKARRGLVKPRIVRGSFGRVQVVTPKE